MITCRRPRYTRLSLSRLLGCCDDDSRVWVWHNGTDEDTLDVIRPFLEHPRLHRFHHSIENQFVREPTNWIMREGTGEWLGVVADDTMITPTWLDALRTAHQDIAEAGILAGWHFHPDDFLADVAARKTRPFAEGHEIMINPWVQGSGVIMKRQCVEEIGLLGDHEKGFTGYCIRAAAAGWINGWYMPILPIDHMDDPRSPHTLLKSDADIAEHLPLSAQFRGIRTLEAWIAHLRRSARIVQEAPMDPRQYVGLRKRVRRLWTRVRRRELIY